MYTFIIIFGLAIGLAASLIIAQYVRFELSFDEQYRDRDRIHYAYMKIDTREGVRWYESMCHPAVAPFIARTIPEVESSVRLVPFKWNKGDEFVLRREENGKTQFYTRVTQAYQVDPEFLDFFSVPMAEGNHKDALKDHYSIVITKRLAEKFFGDEPALNRMLRFSYNGFPVEIRVSGVTENPLPNSSVQFDVLISIYGEPFVDLWSWGIFQTFIKLRPDASPEAVERKINKAAALPLSNLDKDYNGINSIRLHPFKDFHFFKLFADNGIDTVAFTGDRRMINFFITLGIIILIISWVNYINLTTARSLRRAKEVGLRKVSGASRRNLVVQFLMEFFTLNIISLFLALTITQLCFGTFAQSIGSRAEWTLWQEPSFWGICFGFLIFSTLASGLYPAFVMANYNPSKVLKGAYSSSQAGINIRRGLVLVQVGLSVFLLMSIYGITHQLSYMQNKKLGMSTEEVLVIRLDELDTAFTRYEAFEDWRVRMGNQKGVHNVGAADVYPGERGNGLQGFYRANDPEKKIAGCQMYAILGDYPETMSMELLEGRTFSSYTAYDSTIVMISETAARDMGFDSPASAIGQEITLRRGAGDRTYKVVGVIRDFFTSVKDPAQGVVMHNGHWRENGGYMAYTNVFVMKLSTQNVASTMQKIQREWSVTFNDAPFDYFFLDTFFNTFYKEERQFAGVFGFFSIIGVVITCMGLFGLSLFDTGSRTKEVGIRKSLGGSPSGIMWLFSKAYLKLILLASVITIPVGTWILNDWLKNYPQRIELGVDIVVVPVVLMILIALFTIGYQTFKAAHMNPVSSLRAD